MKITMHDDYQGDYTVDLYRRFEGYEHGDLICFASPWALSGVPLELEIAIRRDGSLIFRSWEWGGNRNNYLHTREKRAEDIENQFERPFIPTQAQIDTVNGLFSGRILFDGCLHLAPGASLQKICPIDVAAEEARVGKKIYLA